MPDFDLTERGWIPCLMKTENKLRELSLRECLCRAHDIREVFDNSPLVTVALQRLLLAVLHASFAYNPNAEPRDWRGPRSFEQWKSLWEQGHFDAAKINGYLNHWRHRFNLFDPERPFFQVPQMQKKITEKQAAKRAEAAAKKPKAKPKSNEPEWVEFHPLALLAHEAASAHNASLFDHRYAAAARSFTAVEAARYLVARQAFSIGGGVSQPFNLSNAPLVNGYTVFTQGDSLFETLLLNMPNYTDERPIPIRGEDAPVWEQEVLEKPYDKGTQPHGYLDYLTWQSRRIHLKPPATDATGLLQVTECQLLQNLKLSDAQPLFDPFKGYIESKKEGHKARDINPQKALWRDSHALFQQNNAQKGKAIRPAIFERLAEIDQARRRGQIKNAAPVYSFAVYGFANDKASVFLWSREQLPLPLTYLNDPDLVQALQEASKLADDFHQGLKDALSELAKSLATKEDASKVVASFGTDELYWGQLEAPFRTLLVNLPERNDEFAAERAWAQTLEASAQAAFNQIVNGLDGSARSHQAATLAGRLFNKELGKTKKKHPDQFPPSSTKGDSL
jgi:CRISPR system Cascade subunit CasA